MGPRGENIIPLSRNTLSRYVERIRSGEREEERELNRRVVVYSLTLADQSKEIVFEMRRVG